MISTSGDRVRGLLGVGMGSGASSVRTTEGGAADSVEVESANFVGVADSS